MHLSLFYFIGDGKSKSHADFVEKDPYDRIVLQNYNARGQIQKGGRLRKSKWKKQQIYFRRKRH